MEIMKIDIEQGGDTGENFYLKKRLKSINIHEEFCCSNNKQIFSDDTFGLMFAL